MVQIILIWPPSIRSSEWRGITSITSAVWSTSSLSTRAVTFHALHVTLGKYHQETRGYLSLLCWWYSALYFFMARWNTPNWETYGMHSRYKKWMTNNFLLQNSKKAEVLIIGPKKHKSNNLEHCLTLDGCSLDSSSSVRNLGVLFDSNLSFDSHISNICKTAFFHLKIYPNWDLCSRCQMQKC